jgi:hypothetical protein
MRRPTEACAVRASVPVASNTDKRLGVGNFELNFEDGTLRYRSGIYTGDDPLSVAVVRHLFYITNTTMDDYFPAILAVLYGNTQPQLAVSRAEEAIELRRVARNANPLATGEPLVDDAVVTEPEVINEELAALLATCRPGGYPRV